MFNSYLQLELRRKNIWHAGHHKTMASFKSVSYVHNRCRSRYRKLIAVYLLRGQREKLMFPPQMYLIEL